MDKSVRDNFKRGQLCGICNYRILSRDHANIDHIVPKSRGGTDHADNLQLVHKWCNQWKGSMIEGEYTAPTFAWNIKCLALYKLGLLKF